MSAGPSSAGLVHHSDRGVPYVCIRYTERLADAGIAPSVGSVGDSYDNALAESIIGLFKAEVIRIATMHVLRNILSPIVAQLTNGSLTALLVMRSAQCLAINGDHLRGRRRADD